jgi:uncharacterized protein (UPF0335 family)
MNMQVPDSPTPGETKLVLDTILETLREVKSKMATKDFVDSKFTSFNDRVERIESDVKKIHQDSTRSTGELKKMITDRINQVIADFDEESVIINTRIDQILESKAETEKEKRARLIYVYMAVFGAVLSLIVSVTTAALVNGLSLN